MKKTAYGHPILIKDDEVVLLNKEQALDEATIQNLIFDHPDCLPISDIDESYNPVIPVCTELNTPVGPLDILMVTPDGELVIIETKLWRNPEARRKVVAQILDYAKELSNWNYEDLQREVNRKLKTKGNTLYNIAATSKSHLVPPEDDFVDSVSRNLSRGKYLLLIAGDGIREGVKGITEFLSNAGHLNFTLAMVELSIYSASGIGQLIVPKVLVKTVEISRMIVEIPQGLVISTDLQEATTNTSETRLSPEKEKTRNYYIKFWQELIQELVFDDPGQPIPKPGTSTNLYVYPAISKKVWISAYFMKSKNRVGVYFRAQNDTEGNEILGYLRKSSEEMKSEFGEDVNWEFNSNGDASVRLYCEDVHAEESREEIKEFFKHWLNEFVNVFRPRLKRFEQESS